MRMIKRMEGNILKRWIDLWHKCCNSFTNAYLSSSFVCQSYLSKVLFKKEKIVFLRASTRIIKDLLKVRLEKITFPMIFLDLKPNSWLAVVLKTYCRWPQAPLSHHLIRLGDSCLRPAPYLMEFTVITENIFLQSSCSDGINILDIQSAIVITTRSLCQILWSPTHTLASLLSLPHPPWHRSKT